jgi:type 2 lantibiotic, mersacidin/lichenicidin family
MKPLDVIRAWKDAAYRESLSEADRSLVPQNPAGLVELTDEQLRQASGLSGIIVTTFKTCTDFTVRRFHCCN